MGTMTARRRALLAQGLALLATSPLAAQTPREIIDRVDQLLRGQSSRGIITMEVVTEHWSRSMEMRIWSLGTEYALIRITAPAKDAGTATLKAGNEIWNYLPHVDRTIKLPSSLMGASWMGSHFTNDDLVKESRMIDDYDIAIGYDGPRDGVPVWEFVLTPKPEAAVVWGKIEEQIRKADLMPVWARFYDDQGKLARTMTSSDYRVMGGRLVPTRTLIRPADKPNEHTAIVYRELEFNVALDRSFFSLRRLQSTPGR